MQGRAYSSASYRYGFNGKEKEADGTTDNYDFGARIYDGRLARWLSLDPLAIEYPSISPNNFCNNNAIVFLDPDGKIIELYRVNADKTRTLIATVTKGGVMQYAADPSDPKKEKKFDATATEVADFNAAKEYLSKSAKGKEVFDRVIDSDKKVSLDFLNTGNSQTFISSVEMKDKDGKTGATVETAASAEFGSGTIAWNSHQGMIDNQGNPHSAAMVLMHELVHADNAIADPLSYEKRVAKKYDDNKTNEEEMTTIGITNDVIKELEAANKPKSPMIKADPNQDGHTAGKDYRKDHAAQANPATSGPTVIPSLPR